MNVTKIKDINYKMLNSRLKVAGGVKNIRKTSGPYLVFLEDEDSEIVCVTYDKPNFDVGDRIEIYGTLQVGYNGFQIRIEGYNVLEQGKTKVEFKGFLIQNPILEKLKPKFIEAASMIKDAVLKQRPIVVKHHNDADGYSGALALEEAILGLISEKNNSFLEWNLFSRIPSTTPFYDYFDATEDIASALSKETRYGNAKPLLIIVDNGSTESDEVGIKLVKAFGFQVIVLDHHIPIDNKDIDVHINPHLVGGDSNITAGMLAVELAKIVNPNFKSYFYAGISAIGDRSNIEDYFKLVDIPLSTLKKMAVCIDFQAKFLRRMEARGLIQELLNLNNNHLDIIFNEIEKRLKKQVALISMNLNKERLGNGINFLTLDYKKVRIFKDFPSIGNNAGLLINEFGDGNTVAVVYDEGIAVIRSTNPNFDFNDLLKKLEVSTQYGIRGGGHKHAGTIMFISVYTDEILSKIKEYVSNLQA